MKIRKLNEILWSICLFGLVLLLNYILCLACIFLDVTSAFTLIFKLFSLLWTFVRLQTILLV